MICGEAGGHPLHGAYRHRLEPTAPALFDASGVALWRRLARVARGRRVTTHRGNNYAFREPD